jgi:hypothetical protein
MLIVLIIGLSAVALLAVFLKRRHARKVEGRQATMSGFRGARDGSSPEVGHGQDMWGPHQHMAHTGGWEYTTEQDREMREASAAAGGGILGGVIGKSKSLKGRTLSRKSKHGSKRSARHFDTHVSRVRGGGDEHTRDATASIRRSKSERRRDRERARERDKEIERGLRGLPIKDNDEMAGKEKQRADVDDRSRSEMFVEEKDFG